MIEDDEERAGMMTIKTCVVSGILAAISIAPALAQTDAASTAHLASANQLGVLEYCHSQGFIDKAATSSERDVIARLPSSSVSTGDAEATGKSGVLLSPNGAQFPLAQLASSHNTTVAALCKQMGSSVIQASSALGQGGMNGMTMPTVPGGVPQMPTMPTMPTMPAMPGTPPGTGTVN